MKSMLCAAFVDWYASKWIRSLAVKTEKRTF